LLGIADEISLAPSAAHGIDTFDSCFPTRLGRHGTLLTRQGRLKIGKAEHRADYSPIDPECDGFVSRTYSRAYLHHLWRAREPLVHSLLTLHNIKFMNDLCADLRQRILRGEA
jgi:queuine tRNA-ribosyltransferase